jgi:erythritol kinase (D-erythritol 1-phosphate-forming)
MTRDILIGVDAGTSVIKAVAFTTDGTQIGIASRPNVTLSPMHGAVEQNMKRTWNDCAATLKELTETVPNLAQRALALAVTAQGDGTWLIDKEGEPCHDGWLWLDARAARIVAEVTSRRGYTRHYSSTGSGLNACMQSAQLLWMRQNQPDVIRRAATALHCKDYLYFRLTGIRAIDPSETNYTFGSYKTRQIQDDIIADLGLSDLRHLWPEMVDGTRTSHGLSAVAAHETGLPSGLPVMLGYLDVVCSALGGGLYESSGRVGSTIIGTTGMHMRFVPKSADVKLNHDRSGYTMVFPVPDAVSQMQSNMASTPNIDWLIDVAVEGAAIGGAHISRKDVLANLDGRIADAPAGAALYHPYIVDAGERGPFLNPSARAQFSGLNHKTGFAGLMRSVFEGLAFAARDCYTTMGGIPAEIRVAGGAARSKILRSIFASVLNANVRTVTREETGAAGAVMMAAVNLGIYTDMAACAEAWVTPALGEPAKPDAELVALYDGLFPVYRQIREGMAKPWDGMAALRG